MSGKSRNTSSLLYLKHSTQYAGSPEVIFLVTIDIKPRLWFFRGHHTPILGLYLNPNFSYLPSGFSFETTQ